MQKAKDYLILEVKKVSLKYNPDLFSEWRTGKLPKQWRVEYPKLFDDDDLRVARTQPRYHFAEWLAAIYYYKKGFQVLVEQYIYKPHFRKLGIIKGIIGEKWLSFLRRGESQPPDLFVYDKNGFFFVEVKMPGDKLQENQKKFFQEIEKKLKTRFVILQLNS